MLRGLVSEVVSRRLWPIPLVAILIAIAAPLLFMKPAPVDTPVVVAEPPAVAPAELPAGAERLVASTDKARAPRKRRTLGSKDPFAPPASAVSAATEGAAASGPSDPPGQGSGAATSTPSDPPGQGSGAAPPGQDAGGSAPAAPKKTATTTKNQPAPDSTTSKASESDGDAPDTVTYVDLRFAPRIGSKVRRRVPRVQTFRAGGRVAAIFVRYSSTRDKAVFAIAPSTQVSGEVKCRKVERICRFVDIRAGQHARLTLRGNDGSLVSRRLDIVRVRELPRAGNESASPRVTSLPVAFCLLNRLLKLPATAPSISADSCD